jgi:curli biogenesis system outer membrane secretion channel CsgG
MKNSKFVFILLISMFLLIPGFLYAERYQGNRRGPAKKTTVTSTTTTTTTTTKTKVKSGKIVVPVAIPAPIGPKKLIAVAEFENKTNWAGQANLGTGMADQLITTLVNSDRFIVLERQSLEAVLREQDFGASSRTKKEGGAKIGEISRAQILIQGSITEFDQKTSSGGGGFSYGGISFSSNEATAHVAVDVRVYDTTTGHILASKACKGTAKASGGGIGFASGDWAFAAGGEAKTPLDFAVRDAITQAVDFIALELQKLPWEGRVAMVKEGDIYINCGRTTGIMAGDQFSVFKPGEAIIDPETGINLGAENKFFGKIEVIKVEEKFSKATIINGTGFERNDIVKYEGPKPAAPPPAALPQPVQ